MVELNGRMGGKSGDIFRTSPPEASTTFPLTSIFSLDILNGQKVTIYFLGRTALEILPH